MIVWRELVYHKVSPSFWTLQDFIPFLHTGCQSPFVFPWGSLLKWWRLSECFRLQPFGSQFQESNAPPSTTSSPKCNALDAASQSAFDPINPPVHCFPTDSSRNSETETNKNQDHISLAMDGSIYWANEAIFSNKPYSISHILETPTKLPDSVIQ